MTESCEEMSCDLGNETAASDQVEDDSNVENVNLDIAPGSGNFLEERSGDGDGTLMLNCDQIDVVDNRAPVTVSHESESENNENESSVEKTISQVEVQDLLNKALICRLPLTDLSILLRSGADINGFVRRGLRPIHYAAFDNNTEGLRFLLENKCQINVHDVTGHTAVHICAKRGNVDCLKILLEHGAYASFMGEFADEDDRAGWSEISDDPLNLALQFGHVECARLLIEQGANPNNRYFLGSEINLLPLQNLDCLHLLLERNANPNSLARNGLSPLMTACKEQNYEAVDMLLLYRADLNLRSPKRFEEKTALYFCILSGNCEILALLLERGVNVRAPVSLNNHALTFAVSRDRYMMCQLLIAHGSDVNERNSDGLTPLLALCSTTGLRHHIELLELLLENGADPNSHHHTMRYFTPSLAPIHEYFVFNRGENFCEDFVKLLVKYGARVTFGLSHCQKHIKEPFSVLNHVRKLDTHEEILSLLVEVAERFDCKLISQCDLIPCVKRSELVDVGSSPLSLKHIVRLSLRRTLGTVLPQKVEMLPLPKLLKSYLVFYL